MSTVDIVLATYNGEKYLSEQLDSIIAQSHQDWRLLISDDGSSDDTLSLLERYAVYDERILLVNRTRQGGVVKNFSKALEHVTSNYIMFSDQDDFWLPDKVLHTLEMLISNEKSSGNMPLLVFTDLIVVDEDLKIIKRSFYADNNINPLNNLDARYLLWRSTVYGCTVMFNKALYEVAMPFATEVTMHDQWFALRASLTGRVLYLDKSYIYYRQHANNVVGGRKRSFVERLKFTFISMRNIKKAAYLTSETVVAIFGERERLFFSKLTFVRKNVLPYFYEKKIYSLLFVVYYLMTMR